MRIGRTIINNQEYPIVFSTAVAIEVEERTGKTAGAGIEDILGSGKLSDLFWLLSRMIRAGAAYMQLTGGTCPEPLSLEALATLVGFDDYATVFGDVFKTATDGVDPEIVVEGDPKNAIASQGL